MMKKKFILSIIFAILFIGNSLNAQWIEVDSGYESPWIFYSMCFPEGQNDTGFIAGMYTTYDGDGVILKTEDGGQTWTTNYGGTSGTIIGLQAICFTSTDVGYAGGWDDDLLYTEDGGDTWTTMTVGSGIWYFTDIEFWDEDNGVACAQMDGGGQPVFITDDGGDTWTQATSGISQVPFDITYADATTLYLVGNGGTIDKSTDGGYTWSTIYTAGGLLFGVDFEGTQFGVVGAEEKMLATTNGGSSWSSNVTGYEHFWAAKAFTGDSAYVGGTDERIHKTLDGGNTWTLAFNGNPVSTFYKFAFTQNNTGFVCGSAGKIFYKEAPLAADFEADQTTVCAGSSVNFTDLSTGAISWSWTFEGGTPSSSTDQNPTITYNTPGTYNVELTVSDGSAYETETKYDYITVIDSPGQADTPEGDTAVCTDNYYVYTTDEVDYAEDYEWELTPADAGTLEVDGNTASLTTADDWTGDFTIRVRATNMCDDGAWSDYLECTLYQSPDIFTLEGGGSYCNGGEGVEITLDGSQTGVDYELYLDGDPTGNIVSGTGSEISFGLVTDEGYYSCYGSNDNCSQLMTDQIEVTILFPPLEPDTPEGPEVVCEEISSDYTSGGSDDANSYEWELLPEEAGTISWDNLDATVEWDPEFIGIAMISLYGINDCGEGNSSNQLEISVGSPNPEVGGEGLVCDWSEEIYSAADNDGSTYTWVVTGGTITEGQGTYVVTVSWEGEGNGTVAVTEETENGCTGSSDTLDVFIDDCTGIGESKTENIFKIYPNPTHQTLNMVYSGEGIQDIKLMIFNHLGQVVRIKEIKTNKGSNAFGINVEDLTNGLYFIKIQSGNNLLMKKQFIKN